MDAATLRQHSRLLVRQLGMLDNQCGKMDLTPVEAHTLIELDDLTLSVDDIMQRLRIDKTAASRTLAILLNQGLVSRHACTAQPSSHDHSPPSAHQQGYQLTPAGQHKLTTLHQQLNQQVEGFLAQLDSDEITQLGTSLSRYIKAMQTTEAQHGYTLRLLTPLDNAAMAAVVRRVSAEFGLTPDKGYGVADPTLDCLSEVYRDENCAYWVIEKDNRILGGGGIAPLAGEPGVCELQKMYFLPALRGKGFARRLTATALKFARQHGFDACYLETTACLQAAVRLYEDMGFAPIPHALGNTGHDACEIRLLKAL
ncbi:GNAT family N-acetyltransferase [Photobacterium aphoticum]|uniref:Histone acetyltransferase HPA2 n=2 Tax=Photobacterium aphoticum TaxID=754436 RepID=A0A090RHS3_9GAMM|nr:helix-turn-helix domain-containing GNAT family N-acetyltransferase [Photobacterium aphoticum]PSU50442.1 MarR family transcriptional regulator [Photobacterium aphoticum]GAL07072.1 histone acetyltransferase HPA2 [Photobacterium aphoticum]GHA66265.1 MarR family transcriptional regulator [Photobacterium aphoticum]